MLDRVDLEGVELEYDLRGDGDVLALIHAGVCADFFEPLQDEPALAERSLQLALDAPDLVQTLALLDAAARRRRASSRSTSLKPFSR